MSDNDRLTLMAVFAHPDDESFGTGGTLARYSDPKLTTHERLGEVREYELRCACQHLGVEDVHFLGYRDSGMAGTEENLDPRSLAMADLDEVVGKIVAHIRRERPEVIVTFDEAGGYGHPDHIAIHYHAKAAFAAAADPAMYPEQIDAGLEAHQAKKLYFTAIPRRFFRDVAAKVLELGIEIPERYLERLEGPIGLPDEACTTDVDVRGFLEAKQAAVQCHATQLHPDSIFALLPEAVMRELQTWECFQLAESYVGEDGDSHDLLTGLR
jgi:LmbE family N-acetylglucosaminyl deacetylase